MKKPLNVLSKATLATVFAATALIPVASVEAADTKDENIQYDLQEVVFLVDDKYGKVSLKEYLEEFSYGFRSDIQYVMYPNGEAYKIKDYLEEYSYAPQDTKEVYENLFEKGKVEDKIYQAYFDEGILKIKDEQPEDRLNETFFYNFAA